MYELGLIQLIVDDFDEWNMISRLHKNPSEAILVYLSFYSRNTIQLVTKPLMQIPVQWTSSKRQKKKINSRNAEARAPNQKNGQLP